VQIDGNNLLAVYDTITGVRDYCIKEQKPYLIECMTFRMRGHEEASGTKYVPKELFEEWAAKDPVKNFENYLILQEVLTYSEAEKIKANLKEYIEAALKIGFEASPVIANTEEELADIYAPLLFKAPAFTNGATKEMRLIDAISNGLHQSMQQHANLILMGQDIAEYGGAFKITEGFVAAYGKERVRNTPLCESAIVGTALGLSLEGYKSMMEMQFADFVTVGFNQIVNNLAKIYYRWGQNADVVIRMPTGGGVGAGPFHSQSNEAWFTKVPGLKVVYPSTPADAKGLLIAAINDPNPVLFFEHKALYRSVSGPVPESYYEIEIGKAATVQVGTQISIITYGSGVHWALAYAAEHPALSIEIIDLRSLLPLDYDAICNTVKNTGKVLLLHEDTLLSGIGGEIAAWIAEHCFELLDAPVMRCASLDTPVPFNITLEQNFMAKSRLHSYVQKLLAY
ncbi:MAG: dehydrogenase, partial [Sphingobacteriales bacterium]